MKLFRSMPFILLYISVAILVVGCVLGGMEEMFKPFDILPLAVAIGIAGTFFTLFSAIAVGEYVYKKIKDGEFEDDDE